MNQPNGNIPGARPKRNMGKKGGVNRKRQKKRAHRSYLIGAVFAVLLLVGVIWKVSSSKEQNLSVLQEGTPGGAATTTASPSHPFEVIAKRILAPRHSRYTRYGIQDIELGMTLEQIKHLGYEGGMIGGFDNMDAFQALKTANGREIDIQVVTDLEGRATYMGMGMTHVRNVQQLITDSFGEFERKDMVATGTNAFALRYVNPKTVIFVYTFESSSSGNVVSMRVVDREDYTKRLTDELWFLAELILYIRDISDTITAGTTDTDSFPQNPNFSVERIGNEWLIYSEFVDADERSEPRENLLAVIHQSANGIAFSIRNYQLRGISYKLPYIFRVRDFAGLLREYFPSDSGKISVQTGQKHAYNWIDKNGFSVEIIGREQYPLNFINVRPPQKAAW